VSKDNNQRLSKYFSLLAFLTAFITTIALMLGDQYGRVNLLYLQLIFVFVPLVSLGLTLYCSFFKSQFNLSQLFLQLPFWPSDWLDDTAELKNSILRKPWLFYQSQKLALALSLGALAAFFCTLLLSDVSFVWRSTLLSADSVFPLLQFISLPWFFIEAQPLMEQVQSSQDSRLVVATGLSNSDVWWRYVLLAQLYYVLLPRTMLFTIAKIQLSRARIACNDISTETNNDLQEVDGNDQLQQLQHQLLDLSQSALLSWSVLPDVLQSQLMDKYGQAKSCHLIGAAATVGDIQSALGDPFDKVVIVASWEPPMGELEDFMRASKGTLLVLDWESDQFQKVNPLHLDEWRRFCFAIKNWQLQQLEELI